MPGVADSGKDAVIVGAGIRIPLWQGSYSDSIAAARADARAQRADQRALEDRASAELTTSLSNVEDAVRRVALYRGTLVPQAESAYDSVLGAYTVGRGTVAQALLAQRDLLELRIELDRARADYERAWARLEEITGREVRRASIAAEGESAPEATDE
ncbi:MAG: TolC family protein, partial [Myxococcales bacterium]|nr:TolC family protein [Myxococcales bacterium]